MPGPRSTCAEHPDNDLPSAACDGFVYSLATCHYRVLGGGGSGRVDNTHLIPTVAGHSSGNTVDVVSYPKDAGYRIGVH